MEMINLFILHITTILLNVLLSKVIQYSKLLHQIFRCIATHTHTSSRGLTPEGNIDKFVLDLKFNGYGIAYNSENHVLGLISKQDIIEFYTIE